MTMQFRALGGGGRTFSAPNPKCCGGPDLCPKCRAIVAYHNPAALEEADGAYDRANPPNPYRAAMEQSLSADVPDDYDRSIPPDGHAIAVARLQREGR